MSKIVITTPYRTEITATRLPITIKPAKFNVKNISPVEKPSAQRLNTHLPI